MGYWCTLHLFDQERFQTDGIPKLRGERGDLVSLYEQFLHQHRVGGTAHLPKSEVNDLVCLGLENIHEIANTFDLAFKVISAFHSKENYDEQIQYINRLDGHYEFCRFFEYYLFRDYADFFPHIPLGKGGVGRNFETVDDSNEELIIGELDYWNEFLSWDTSGITNWTGPDEAKLLFLGIERLRPLNGERADAILRMVEVAHEFGLGLISGVDLNESLLERLPGNKLVPASRWNKMKVEGILFGR